MWYRAIIPILIAVDIALRIEERIAKMRERKKIAKLLKEKHFQWEDRTKT